MRYTRYNYTKHKSNLLSNIIIIILAAILIGTLVFKVFLVNLKSPLSTTDNNGREQIKSEEKISYYNLQCGVYSTKENADEAINKLPKEIEPFIFEDEGKFKIVSNIYTKDQIDEKKASLDNSSIENYKIEYCIKQDTTNNIILNQVIDGYLKIQNKLKEDSVESINTIEFKKWIKDIYSKCDEKNVKLDDFINFLLTIPDDYKKENINDGYINLVKVLEEYKI